jgi:hypothetical protein
MNTHNQTMKSGLFFVPFVNEGINKSKSNIKDYNKKKQNNKNKNFLSSLYDKFLNYVNFPVDYTKEMENDISNLDCDELFIEAFEKIQQDENKLSKTFNTNTVSNSCTLKKIKMVQSNPQNQENEINSQFTFDMVNSKYTYQIFCIMSTLWKKIPYTNDKEQFNKMKMMFEEWNTDYESYIDEFEEDSNVDKFEEFYLSIKNKSDNLYKTNSSSSKFHQYLFQRYRNHSQDITHLTDTMSQIDDLITTDFLNYSNPCIENMKIRFF